MSLVGEVMAQVEVRDSLSVEDDGFSGHKAHQTLDKQLHQHLLQERNDHTALRSEIQLVSFILWTRSRVEEVKCLCDCFNNIFMCEVFQ